MPQVQIRGGRNASAPCPPPKRSPELLWEAVPKGCPLLPAGLQGRGWYLLGPSHRHSPLEPQKSNSEPTPPPFPRAGPHSVGPIGPDACAGERRAGRELGGLKRHILPWSQVPSPGGSGQPRQPCCGNARLPGTLLGVEETGSTSVFLEAMGLADSNRLLRKASETASLPPQILFQLSGRKCC